MAAAHLSPLDEPKDGRLTIQYGPVTAGPPEPARYPAATRHRIAKLLVPYRLDAPKRIFNFMDDQGHDADLYFTDADENTFKVVLKKLANT